MSAPLAAIVERVGKALALEARQGYGDRAASGGLAGFTARALLPLRGRLPSRAGDDRLASVLELVRDYEQLDLAARAANVEAALLELRALYRDLRHAGVSAAASGGGQPPVRPAQPNWRLELVPLAPATRTAGATRPKPPVQPLPPDAPIAALPGAGAGRAKQLGLLGVRTVGDLLYLIPRRHIDYSQQYPVAAALYGREGTVKGVVHEIGTQKLPAGKSLVVARVGDESGTIEVTWFNPYVARQLHRGDAVALSGTIDRRHGRPALSNPEWEVLDVELLHTGRIVPIYPLTKGLYQKPLRALVRQALEATSGTLDDAVPEETRRRLNLPALWPALSQLHFPDSFPRFDAARRRLAFDEFFMIQLDMQRRKRDWQLGAPGHAFTVDTVELHRFFAALPFQLTGAQRRAVDEVIADMRAPRAMNRLIQGDVGSGKTVVAAAAMYAAAREGLQSVLMAPTAILAEQHARTLVALYDALPAEVRPVVRLLVGATPVKERREIHAGLLGGQVDVLVGTQAVIQAGVEFERLGFAVVDEQHRFGVTQRAALRGKGFNPDLLVMTATPIPRSLALTLHGDLDVAILDEMPPGRQPVATRCAGPEDRERVYRFVAAQIEAGHQAFVICPLVEESGAIEARAAEQEYERLRLDVFPQFRLGLLHGRLRPAEKDRVMARFRDGDFDILVSTSVVEVGIDVPNATVMLIEGAERFGLAQLHQFRGRVGRGSARAYCVLLSETASGESSARLQAMVDSQDGFELARIDLELRGPGEFFGTRQSGQPDLKVARLEDLDLLETARQEAARLLDADPSLERHPAARALLAARDRRGAGDVS